MSKHLVSLLLLIACSNASADDDGHSVCSNATINGNYGFSMTGSIQPFGNVALSGTIRSNGRGSFSGVEMASIGGQIAQATYSGAYSVNADCTGTAQYQLVAPNLVMSRSINFVITKRGAEFFMLSTVPGSILAGKAQRQ